MGKVSEDSTAGLKKILTMIKFNRFQVLLILIISSIVFIGLGESSLLDYDEGIYAGVARTILQTNDWVTLHYKGNPWFEKPPIYIWSTAILFKIFGINEFWARAASAFSAVIVVVCTYLLGSVVFDRRVGLLTVIPLLTGYEFLKQARNGTTDVMLTLFMLMILTVYIIHPKKDNLFWYLFWVLFAIGFMVKFWAALIVIIAIGIEIILERDAKKTLACKHFWLGIVVALLLILPWHITMYVLHRQAFLDRYVIYDLFSRTTGALQGNTGSIRYYFDRMLYDFAPWSLMLPIAITVELSRIMEIRDRSRTLIIFIATIFGTYSIVVSTKLFQYLTPIYPILAVLIANVMVKAFEDHKSFSFSGLVFTALIAIITLSEKSIEVFGVLIVPLVIFVLFIRSFSHRYNIASVDTNCLHRRSLIRSILDGSNRLLYISGALIDKYLPKIAVVFICIFLASIGILRSRQLYKNWESPVERISKIAGSSKILTEETIIGLALPSDYEVGILGPSAMFYSNRPIVVAWTEENLRALTSKGSREIIMAEKFIETLDHEYKIVVLERSSPFIYGIISQNN